MKRKVRFVNLQLKSDSLDEEGTFEGYGSVFGVKDVYNDVVAKGAFKRTLKERGLPKLLYQHDPSRPIGKFLEVREDAHGLYVKGQVFIDTADGADAYTFMKRGAVDGLSIGYFPVEWNYDEKTRVLTLKEVDLLEVSLVTFPANEEARIEEVRSRFFGDSVNSDVGALEKRVRHLELMLESKTAADGEPEDVEEVAEAEPRDASGEDDGAEEVKEQAFEAEDFAAKLLERITKG